jgi:site-specific DNA-methyltransferase (adenine-specific)
MLAGGKTVGAIFVNPEGRFPANLIHDGSDEVLRLFPDPKGQPSGSAARFFYCAKTSSKDRHEGLDNPEAQFKHGENLLRTVENTDTKGNKHPTVKPTELMKYLCRLITPVGGLVLDPFMGSGSTGKAALLEGFRFYGIEREQEYVDIAKARIEHAAKESGK